MKVKVVKYGRTIEVGKFGKGPSGRVWFGWEVELEEGEDAATILNQLRDEANMTESMERLGFNRRAFGGDNSLPAEKAK